VLAARTSRPRKAFLEVLDADAQGIHTLDRLVARAHT
jgi:hypothetical protein